MQFSLIATEKKMNFSRRNITVHAQLNDPRWDEYVLKTVGCSLYHLSRWRSVIEDVFGHKTYYLMSLNESNECNGILPLVHMHSRIFGSFLVSLPFFNYGGICADDSSILEGLLEEAIELAKGEGVPYIELRSKNQLNISLPVKTIKVCMQLNLSPNSEDLWQRFTSKLRSQIRKPLKGGMTVKIGGAEEIESFYHVFSINMRDLGTPVYPKLFFINIFKQFPDTSRICTVYDSCGNPVASGFLLGFRETLEIPWASSLRKYNHLSPNMLLYWSALKFACDSGYKTFDFGRSTVGGGTYKFKQQWGARPVQLYWYYWLRNKTVLPDLTPTNSKYKLAIDIWKRLPISLTRVVGPAIIKYIP